MKPLTVSIALLLFAAGCNNTPERTVDRISRTNRAAVESYVYPRDTPKVVSLLNECLGHFPAGWERDYCFMDTSSVAVQHALLRYGDKMQAQDLQAIFDAGGRTVWTDSLNRNIYLNLALKSGASLALLQYLVEKGNNPATLADPDARSSSLVTKAIRLHRADVALYFLKKYPTLAEHPYITASSKTLTPLQLAHQEKLPEVVAALEKRHKENTKPKE